MCLTLLLYFFSLAQSVKISLSVGAHSVASNLYLVFGIFEMCILMLKYEKINCYIRFVLRYISFDVCL